MTIEERWKQFLQWANPYDQYAQQHQGQSPWVGVKPAPAPGPEEFGANADYIAEAMKRAKEKK